MSVRERLAWISDSIRDRVYLHRQLQIRPTDYVLDVGSGASPNLRANVLCDKYALDGTERFGTPLQSDRPCIVGDVDRLPFADAAFDYVICSHVLEHLPDPARALAELQRVAPRGYIETPSASWEKVQGYPFHRWAVSLEGDTLCFEEKPRPAWDSQLSQWFNELQDTLEIRRKVWFARRRVGVFTSLVWEGAIPHRIARSSGSQDDFLHASIGEHAIHQASAGGGLGARKVEAWATRWLRRQSDRPWEQVETLLRCPDCMSALKSDDETYSCVGCATSFPIDEQGRPWLLPSAAIHRVAAQPEIG